MSKLSNKDIRTLQLFSMYIQSYGSKVVRTDISVDYEGVDFRLDSWRGDGSLITIPSYDEINDLIKRIIKEENIAENYFGGEGRGYITPIINANDKSLTFSVDMYVMNEDSVGGTIEGDDIPEFVLNWIRNMRETKDYKTGTIYYEGGGDNGYLEDNILVNGKSYFTYPTNIDNWLTNRVTDYGDWYNNEGGYGEININFVEETVTIEGGLYYEDTDILRVEYYASFE